MGGKALVSADAYPLRIHDVEDPHHPVVLVEQQMAVEDAAADEVGEVGAEPHVGVPRHVHGVSGAARDDALAVAHHTGDGIPVAGLDHGEVVDVDVKGMLLVMRGPGVDGRSVADDPLLGGAEFHLDYVLEGEVVEQPAVDVELRGSVDDGLTESEDATVGDIVVKPGRWIGEIPGDCDGGGRLPVDGHALCG